MDEELLSRQVTNGSGSGEDPEEPYVSKEDYMDPNSFRSKIKVKALYNYVPKRDDEHHLEIGCIVSNVNKQDGGWWRGDYNGKKQHWFPANHVMVSYISTISYFWSPFTKFNTIYVRKN